MERPTCLGDLTDDALFAEIQLIGDLVVAASACQGRMDLAELDRVLGVTRGAGFRR